MPRIFHVSFVKEFDCTIIAESAEEVEKALEKCIDSDFDDWSDVSWETSVSDPYDRLKKADRVPTKFKEPDMGIDDGEAVALSDYEKTHPDYMARLHEEAGQLALKLNLDEKNLKIPGT